MENEVWSRTLRGTLRSPGCSDPAGASHALEALREELSAAGGYHELEELGRGGSAVVRLAVQKTLGRTVALKRLDLERDHRRAYSRSLSFLAEARIHGQLQHPNIAPIYDLGADDGPPFIAMKRIEGRSWAEVPAAELPEQLGILLAVCNAVAYAHSRDIVHNDLKPANVMLGPFGEVLLVDWGIAVDIGSPPRPGLRHRSQIRSPCGTPCFMPPELAQGNGGQISAATDIYLLGAILYQLVEGRPPHRGTSFVETIRAAAQGRMPEFAAHWPAELEALCRHCLAARPEDRPGSALELRDRLSTWLRHKESLRVGAESLALLEQAKACTGERAEVYRGFADALTGFRQAIGLWEGNQQARDGLRKTRLSWADVAIAHADFVLAETQLAGLSGPEARTLSSRCTVARAAAKRQRRTLLPWLLLSAALLLILALLVGFALAERAEFAELVAKRRQALEQLAAAAPEGNPQQLLAEIAARNDAYQARAAVDPAALPARELRQNRAAIEALASWFSWAEKQLQLDALPIGDRELALLSEDDGGRLRELARAGRREAAALAVHSRAFDSARLIVRGDRLSAQPLDARLAHIEQTRAQLSAMQVEQCAAALARLRAQPATAEGAAGLESSDELIVRLSGYRVPGVAQLLAETLAAHTQRIVQAQQPIAWSAAEKSELRVVIETLRRLRMPKQALEPLRAFFDVVADADLQVLSGIALCHIGGEGTLAALYRRGSADFGLDSLVWRRIAGTLGRLPNSSRAPETTEDMYVRASARFFKGELEAALADARSVFDDPAASRGLTWELIAHIQRGLGDYEAALAAFEHALAEQPTSATVLGGIANVLSELDRLEESLVYHRRALASDPENAAQWSNMASSLNTAGQLQEALSAYDRSLRLCETAEAHCEKGFTLLELSRETEALAEFERALALDPRLARGWLGRGMVCEARHELDAALRDYDRAAEIDPRVPLALANSALIRLDRQEFQRARHDLERAIEANPADGKAYTVLARLELRLGRFAQAFPLAEKALALRRSHDNLMLRAILNERTGQFEAACRDFEEALLIRDDALIHHYLANIAQRRGDSETALRELDRAIEMGAAGANIHLARATILRGQRRTEEALASLEEAARRDAGHFNVQVALGVTYQEVGRRAEAELALTRAIELQPDSPVGWSRRGEVRMLAGDREGALADYQAALERDPRQPRVLVNRASLIYEQDLAQALLDVEQVLRLDPRNQRGWEQRALYRALDANLEGAGAAIEHCLENWPAHGRTLYMTGLASAHCVGALQEAGAPPEELEAWQTRALDLLERAVVSGLAKVDRLEADSGWKFVSGPRWDALLERVRANARERQGPR